MKTILLTGVAGFIGSHVAESLLRAGLEVTGVDNFDSFYSKGIKMRNLEAALAHPRFTFIESSLEEDQVYEGLGMYDVVVHIAAKAGVGPSVDSPVAYANSNIMATVKLLNYMKVRGMNKLVFASSSSVYGNNRKLPFHEDDPVVAPISPYASTKRSCELIAHTFHVLYGIDVLNLRFFTVYGPRQRPDLAIHKFATMIESGRAITMYGDGSTARDYTYIDDIVRGVMSAVSYIWRANDLYDIINIGSGSPVRLKDMIMLISQAMNTPAIIDRLPMQPGDVDITFASIEKAQRLLDYRPETPFQIGIANFVKWFKEDRVVAQGA